VVVVKLRLKLEDLVGARVLDMAVFIGCGEAQTKT